MNKDSANDTQNKWILLISPGTNVIVLIIALISAAFVPVILGRYFDVAPDFVSAVRTILYIVLGILLGGTFLQYLIVYLNPVQTGKPDPVRIEPVKPGENEQILSVFLRNDLSFNDAARKMQSLAGMYEEICMLFNVSTAEYPLKIIKIESGSLLAAISGFVKSIGFMRWFLTEFTKFVYRNYTEEGKFREYGNKIEFYDKSLDFTKKLEEFGIDTKAEKEKIQKGFSKLIDHANTVIEGQTEIKIDETEITLRDENYKQIMEKRNTKLIGGGQKKALTSSDEIDTTDENENSDNKAE